MRREVIAFPKMPNVPGGLTPLGSARSSKDFLGLPGAGLIILTGRMFTVAGVGAGQPPPRSKVMTVVVSPITMPRLVMRTLIGAGGPDGGASVIPVQVPAHGLAGCFFFAAAGPGAPSAIRPVAATQIKIANRLPIIALPFH